MFRLSSLANGTEDPATDLPRDGAETRRIALFSLYGIGLGVLGAVVAWLLYHLITIFTGLAFYRTLTTQSPLYPPAQNLGILAIIIPVVGGLVVGVMAKYGTDRIRGHGIPEAMEAVLKDKSRVGVRVAVFKPVSAAIAVGTGGPFGAEGPIIQTGGALGSLIGQHMEMSAKERRILLACGGAAGMVGIFNTPIAAVALALELLLFEFRARSLIPVIFASATAAACRTVLLGSKPMFSLGFLPSIGGPLDLLWFVPLGLIIGVCSVLISKALYVVEEFFDRLKIDLIFKPALGALVLGIVAFFQPRVLGMGYTYITDALLSHYGNTTLIGLAIGKSIALIASLGAGTSGGLLAPMLLIGASIGTLFGRGVLAITPRAGINPAICGIVAMSSLFSAAARAPLTSFLFAFELTGDYRAILPLMIGCMVADVVSRTLAHESVMTERLVRRGLRVEQGYESRLLTLVTVGDVMTRTLDTLVETTPLRVVLKGLLGEPVALSLLRVYDLGYTPSAGTIGSASTDGARHAATISSVVIDGAAGAAGAAGADGAAQTGEVCSIGLHQHWTFPVVDGTGRLSGIVTRGELLQAADKADLLDRPAGDFVHRRIVVAFPDESLDTALMRMLGGDYQLLPVVERAHHRRLLGVLSRRDILRAWRLRSLDETHRQQLLIFFRRRHGSARPPASEVDGVGAAREASAGREPVVISTVPKREPALSASALRERNLDTLTLPGEDIEPGDVETGGASASPSEREPR